MVGSDGAGIGPGVAGSAQAETAPQRVLVDAVRDLPGGLVARPTSPADIEALTGLFRAIDIAAYGRTSTNGDEVRAEVASPTCGWARGSVCLWRGGDLVAAMNVFDGLVVNRGWDLVVACRPGEPHAHGIHEALIRAALREGRSRWYQVDPEIELDDPIAKAWCHASEASLRHDLERAGFREARRFWRMSIDHFSLDAPLGAEAVPSPPPSQAPPGYRLRLYMDSPESWEQLHDVHTRAFDGHFDFAPVDAPTLREDLVGEVSDLTQWIVAENQGEVVGFALGSNRYAADEYGYVASLGVVPEHRGRGVATALLRARFTDDAQRGFLGTMLHVDAQGAAGATHLYESVGMAVDQEYVTLHRPLLDLVT